MWSNPSWRKLEDSRLWIYLHAEWQNFVDATARLGAAIGQDGLSAWLSARIREEGVRSVNGLGSRQQPGKGWEKDRKPQKLATDKLGNRLVYATAEETRHLIIATFTASFTTRHATIA